MNVPGDLAGALASGELEVDAPVHCSSGRHMPNGAVDKIDAAAFVVPAYVIDCSAGAAADEDFNGR